VTPPVHPDRSEPGARFRALADATFEAVALHADGVVLLANAAADALMRVPPGALVGRPLLSLVAPAWHGLVRAQVDARATDVYEIELARPDGTTVPVEVRGRSVALEGRVVRVVALRDLTARRQLEAVRATSERLEALAQWIAGVSHALNSPLTAIGLQLDLAEAALDADTPEQLRERLAHARSALARATQTVGHLDAHICQPVPPRPGPGAGAPRPVAPRAPPTSPHLTVLVIDDDPDLAELCAAVLSDHHVQTETDAEVALARLRDGARFDVILCDLTMPGLGGAAFLAQLEAELPDQARRLALATGGAVTDSDRGVLTQADHPPLTKPFDAATLRRFVAEVHTRATRAQPPNERMASKNG
jgi:PAS domain S-box-containing protein